MGASSFSWWVGFEETGWASEYYGEKFYSGNYGAQIFCLFTGERPSSDHRPAKPAAPVVPPKKPIPPPGKSRPGGFPPKRPDKPLVPSPSLK